MKFSSKSEFLAFCHYYLHRNILWASVLCGYICVCEMCNFIIMLTEKCKLCYSMEVNSSSWAPHLYILILTLLWSFSHLPPGPGARSPYNASPGRSKTGEMFIFILFPFDSKFPSHSLVTRPRCCKSLSVSLLQTFCFGFISETINLMSLKCKSVESPRWHQRSLLCLC